MLCGQPVRTAPVISSNAYTSFSVVAAKKRPVPGVAPARNSGELVNSPLKLALKLASSAIFVMTLAFVSEAATQCEVLALSPPRWVTDSFMAAAPPVPAPAAPAPPAPAPALALVPAAPLAPPPLGAPAPPGAPPPLTAPPAAPSVPLAPA